MRKERRCQRCIVLDRRNPFQWLVGRRRDLRWLTERSVVATFDGHQRSADEIERALHSVDGRDQIERAVAHDESARIGNAGCPVRSLPLLASKCFAAGKNRSGALHETPSLPLQANAAVWPLEFLVVPPLLNATQTRPR